MVGDDRGQAFTLEGFIGAVLLLTALLFALQSVVITPTTSGAVDESVQDNLKQQAQDVLIASADDGDLSYLVRYTSNSTLGSGQKIFANSNGPTVGYGSNLQNMSDKTRLPGLLNQTFKQRGRVFNVIVEYRGRDPGDSDTMRLVYQGVPSDNAVVATHTVPLYDDQVATGPNSLGETLEQLDAAGYPVPDAYPNSPLYNLVEIRVVVW